MGPARPASHLAMSGNVRNGAARMVTAAIALSLAGCQASVGTQVTTPTSASVAVPRVGGSEYGSLDREFFTYSDRIEFESGSARIRQTPACHDALRLVAGLMRDRPEIET